MSPCLDFEHARHVRFGSNSVVESHRDRSPLQPDERKSPAKLANPSRAMCGRPRVGKSNFTLRCWSNRAAPGNWPSLRPTPPAIGNPWNQSPSTPPTTCMPMSRSALLHPRPHQSRYAAWRDTGGTHGSDLGRGRDARRRRIHAFGPRFRRDGESLGARMTPRAGSKLAGCRRTRFRPRTRLRAFLPLGCAFLSQSHSKRR